MSTLEKSIRIHQLLMQSNEIRISYTGLANSVLLDCVAKVTPY